MHGVMDRAIVVFRQRRRRHAAWKATLKCEALEGRSLLSAFGGSGAIGLSGSRAAEMNGTAAQTKVQADQAAILSSMGLTQAQITQLQTDQQALQTAIQSGTSASSSTTSTSTTTSTSSASGTASAVQTAMNALQTDLQSDTPSGAQPTHASIGAVQDDLVAIRKGTLTGAAATTQVQTDAAAVLSSMGLTAAQITQIQSDQQALQTAQQANSSSSTSVTSTSSTESTLQSVSPYLVGIPGASAFGVGGMNRSGFGGGFGRGPRGVF